MPKHIPIETGTRFKKLVVIELATERLNGQVAYVCRCDCGNTYTVPTHALRSGNTKSCGCLRSRPRVTDGPIDAPWRIPLWSGGEIQAYALVDPEDGPDVGAYGWSLNKGVCGRRSYRAYRWKKLGPGKRNGKNVMMHRELMGLNEDDGTEVDHINCDSLDNRRSNLRIITGAQNSTNRNPRGQTNSRSGYRGVSWDSQTSKWRATVKYQGRLRHFGRYVTKEEAAAVVRAFRREHMPYSAADQDTPTRR